MAEGTPQPLFMIRRGCYKYICGVGDPPQLFDLNAGQFSGPINTGRTGIVAKLLDKQEPSSDDIAKHFDETREQLLQQRRDEAFAVFISTIEEKYQKEGRIRMNAKAQSPFGGGRRSPI